MNDVEPALITLWNDLHEVHILWQAGVLALSLGLAGWISQMLPAWKGLLPQWQVGVGTLKRIRFPVIALLLVLIGRAILRHYHSVSLLTVAIPLLVAQLKKDPYKEARETAARAR